jgi:hypothetical protein
MQAGYLTETQYVGMENIDKTDLPPIGHHPAALDPPEPRWPAVIAMLAVGLLHLALPPSVSVGPPWLLAAIVGVLIVPTIISHRRNKRQFNRVIGYVTSSVLTVFLIWSLSLLVMHLLAKTEDPRLMLRSAMALWAGNVLIFALWYWRLDAGGPNRRDITLGHRRGAFLFPQMTDEGNTSREEQRHQPVWSPQFIDYLFLAFNTSTAFSPTDVPVLSRWAKVLTMIQSSISLAVVALLAARAVNIL